jgi:hypothetical protein
MVALVFRCPITRLNVQGWIAEKVNGEAPQAVKCLACKQTHLINPKTMRAVGYDDTD